jgi:hypothetical protein
VFGTSSLVSSVMGHRLTVLIVGCSIAFKLVSSLRGP